jgi:hypothetical protein
MVLSASSTHCGLPHLSLFFFILFDAWRRKKVVIVAIENPELDDKRDRRVGRGKRRVMEWVEREEETE